MFGGVNKIILSGLLLAVFVAFGNGASAQYRRARTEVVEDVVMRDSTSVNSYYREGTAFIQFPVGKSFIDPDHADNRAELSKIRGNLDLIRNQEAVEITKVIITGYGSPEGRYDLNERLSVERAQAMIDYMKQAYSEYFTPYTEFEISSMPEDWDGLAELVDADDHLTDTEKDKIFEIIDFNDNIDGRDAELGQINDGATYRYLLDNLYPRLRRVYWRIDFRVDETILHQISDTIQTVIEIPGDTVGYNSYYGGRYEPVEEKEPIIPYMPSVALKTNLLYWAALTPNLALEFYIGDKHSIGFEGAYGNWSINNAKRDWKYSATMAAMEYRYWFDSSSGGHFIGFNGGWGKYNFRFNDPKIPGTGDQGQVYGGGLLYGYSLPIKRFFNIEFAIAVGYALVEDDEYINYRNAAGERLFYHNRSRKTNYVGPTKGSISLVYKF